MRTYHSVWSSTASKVEDVLPTSGWFFVNHDQFFQQLTIYFENKYYHLFQHTYVLNEYSIKIYIDINTTKL